MDNANPDAKPIYSYAQPEPDVTIADMLTLANHGFIGAIELRNWLAERYPSFSSARRSDVDTQIEVHLDPEKVEEENV